MATNPNSYPEGEFDIESAVREAADIFPGFVPMFAKRLDEDLPGGRVDFLYKFSYLVDGEPVDYKVGYVKDTTSETS